MDPVSAVLLSLLASWYFGRNIYQDSVFKARGEDPPSYRRQVERARRRDERRAHPGRQEARRFWANAWADAWASAGEKRGRVHARRQAERRSRWEAEDLAEAEDAAWERNQAMDEAETPDRPEGDPVVLATCLVCLAHVPRQEITTVTVDGVLVRACALCAAAAAARTTPPDGDPEPDPPVPDPSKTNPGEDADREREEKPEPTPEPEPETKPQATEGDVIYGVPFGQDPEDSSETGNGTKERSDMPTLSGETTNLPAALAYTQDMAATADEGVTSVETSIASLTSGGVTGPTLDALRQAQEALTQVALHFRGAHAALVNHIAVQEAYAANRDAGSKEFVSGG